MTSLTGYIQGIGTEKRTVEKSGKIVKLSVYDDIDRVIVFNEAGETSQEGTPTPSDPVDIVGIGTKQLDGTYEVFIDYYDEREERDGRITASGLAYPLYEGDILDFVNGKVIRANGFVDLSTLNWLKYSAQANIFMVRGSEFPTKKQGLTNLLCNAYPINTNPLDTLPDKTTRGLPNGSNVYVKDSDFATAWTDNTPSVFISAMTGNYYVYELETPTDEYITLSGDISDIGTAVVSANGMLTVKYDKVQMAVRKYSAKPDWSKIGYLDTPSFILDGFEYSKQIYDSWTSSASYASAYRGDKALKFFPEVDITGATNYSAMFQESGLIYAPPLTIGDDSNNNVNCQWMFLSSPIEEIEMSNDSETQKVILDSAFKTCSFLKKAKLNLSATGSMASAFAECTRLKRIEDGLETADVTSFSEAFRACSSLEYLRELDLSSCTTCYRAFQNCTSLESAPYLNNILQNVDFAQMFWNCSSLRILPPYNLGSPSNLTNMFQGTGSNLEEASRVNILSMLSACTYSGTKTLAHLGFTASMYSAASWQALSNYNDFVTAGWSIGYN